MMDQFTRGATVRVRTIFRNADGDAIPVLNGASVVISYQSGRQRRELEEPLEQNGDYWEYIWDTREASPGMVFGRVRMLDDPPLPVSAANFTFRLVGNEANMID